MCNHAITRLTIHITRVGTAYAGRQGERSFRLLCIALHIRLQTASTAPTRLPPCALADEYQFLVPVEDNEGKVIGLLCSWCINKTDAGTWTTKPAQAFVKT